MEDAAAPQKQVSAGPEAASEAQRPDETRQAGETGLPCAKAELPAADVVWDAATLTRMVGDYPEMHRRLLDKFLLGSEEQVAAIMSAVAAGDLAIVTAVAHKMKSAARTVGALRLGHLCQEIEISGRADDSDAVNSHTAELEKSFLDVAEQIRKSYSKQK